MMSTNGDGFGGPEEMRRGVARLDAGPVHYREGGEGPALVFVHGFGVNSTLWEQSAARLAGSHRVILPDLPFGSHPEPMKPDADLSPAGAAAIVADFLAELELTDVTLVGNDSGGAICQVVVTERPERVARLVLTNCDCLEEFPPGTFKLLVKALKVPGVSELIFQGMRFDFNRRSPLAFGALTKDRLPGEMLDSWTRPQLEDRAVRRDGKKFGRGMDPSYTLAAAEKLPRLEIPVLLVWGEDDRFFTVELGERLAALIPGARMVRVPDAVTFVPLDQPERVAAEIAGFVEETTGAAVNGRVGAGS